MGTLSDEDIAKIADQLVHKVKEQGHNFWIDPEAHYNQHRALERLLQIYDTASNAAVKTLIGLVIVGGLVVAAFAAGIGKLFGK